MGTPARPAGANAYGTLAGFARNAAATASASWESFGSVAAPVAARAGVRGGAQHALRQRRELSRLRDGDADRRLGHVVAPGDHRRDSGERSGRTRALEGSRGGGAGALDGRRERREGWWLRVLDEDPVERVLRAVGHAAGRRPRCRDELLGGLGGREHADALAHHDPPVGGSEEHAVARRRALGHARVDPAAFEHDCFSASVYSGCASRAVNDLSSAPAYVPGARYAFGGTAVCPPAPTGTAAIRTAAVATSRNRRAIASPYRDGPAALATRASLSTGRCAAGAMRSAVGGCVLNRLANSTLRPVSGFTMYACACAGLHVHRHLLRVRLDLLERAGERLAVVQQVRAARVGLELAASARATSATARPRSARGSS